MTADWKEHGACVGHPADLWFPGRGDDCGPAKAICAQCPVRLECLEHALIEGERFGVWGGLSERERRRIRVARRAKATGVRRNAAACGTESGAKAHKRRGETNCPACRAAVNKASKERKAKRQRGEAA